MINQWSTMKEVFWQQRYSFNGMLRTATILKAFSERGKHLMKFYEIPPQKNTMMLPKHCGYPKPEMY
jgi:hypothetical protein